jgi:hypothetical protein
MGRFTAIEFKANPVPSLQNQKNRGKLEKSAAKEEATCFEKRHFFPLRVNFRFLHTIAQVQAVDSKLKNFVHPDILQEKFLDRGKEMTSFETEMSANTGGTPMVSWLGVSHALLAQGDF